MKTKIFYFALAAVLFFSNANVYADGSKGKKSKSELKSNKVSEIFTEIKDAELELENWMTSLTVFNNKSEIFIEESLQLENWMLSDFNASNEIENFQDEELELETWMLESFEVNNQEKFIDEELELESWMIEIL